MAEKKIRNVKNLRSLSTVNKSLIDEGYPSVSGKMGRRPDYDRLLDGQIGVNYAKGHEVITIHNKDVDENGQLVNNPSNEVVGFLSEKVTYENEHIVAANVAQLDSKIVILDSNVAQLDRKVDTKANLTDLVKTDASITALSDKTDAEEMVSAAGISYLDARLKSAEKTIASLQETIASLQNRISALEPSSN